MNCRADVNSDDDPYIIYESEDLLEILDRIMELEFKTKNYAMKYGKDLTIDTDYHFNYETQEWTGKILIRI